ncbi:MAG: metal ABC transporter ATP-binding protein [Egibacteraceae bacterium]
MRLSCYDTVTPVRPDGDGRGGAMLLVADAVSFAYGQAPVLDTVSLAVSKGEFVALVGPNGSGKSTLVRMLLGLLRPDAGTVRIFGVRPDALRERWRVGYVPQRPFTPDDLPATVAEVVAAGRLARSGWHRRLRRADRDAIDAALDTVGLAALRDQPVRQLSGGQQQRAFIAKALASEPELVVLDEPVAGVDAESQRRFRESLVRLVRERGGAVLLVSHELTAVADDLDRVVVLKRKVLFDGPPGDLTAGGVHLGIHREDLPIWLEGLDS